MHLYTYAFKSETITAVTKNVLALSIIISSVDLTDLTESDLGSIVQLCYNKSEEDTQEKILEKLKKARKDQLEEQKNSVSSGGEQHKSHLGVGNQFSNSDDIPKQSHDAWKEAMKKEEAILR